MRSRSSYFKLGGPSPYGATLLDSLVLREEANTPVISAEAALSIFVSSKDQTKVLFERNSSEKMPIASITKLMTAFVAGEYLAENRQLTISREAIGEPEEAGEFRPGEVFRVGALLYSLLIESSNDAAAALAEATGREEFVGLMNAEAERIGLGDTHFTNPTGLDEDDFNGLASYSTAGDLAKFAKFLMENRRQVFDISATPAYDLRDARGVFHHAVEGTNELLRDHGWPVKILGGKTGETLQARQALLLVTESPIESGYLINVVLGSDDRFGDMKRLVAWVYNSYDWWKIS